MPVKLLQLFGHPLTDASEPFHSSGLAAFHRNVATRSFGSFGDDNYGVLPLTRRCFLQMVGHFMDVVRDFGNQDCVSLSRDTGMERNPTRITAHHFDDDDPAMSLRGRVQPIDALGGERHGRGETKGRKGRTKVVIDGLGDADEAQAFLVQLVRDSQAAVAADGDVRIDLVLCKRLQYPIRTVHFPGASIRRPFQNLEGIPTVGRTEHGSSKVGDILHLLDIQLDQSAVRIVVRKQEAVIALPDSKHLPA